MGRYGVSAIAVMAVTIGSVVAAGGGARVAARPETADLRLSQPVAIVPGRGGVLWVADYGGNSIVRIGAGGMNRVFRAPQIVHPSAIAVASDGAVWFIDRRGRSIGRLRGDGSVREYTDRRLRGAAGLVAGPDGGLWFVKFHDNAIGRIGTDGAVRLFGDRRIREPFRIAAGADHALWFSNHYANTIGRISTSGKVSVFRHLFVSLPSQITSGPGGDVWFTADGAIGRVNARGKIRLFYSSQICKPAGITGGPDGAVWFTNRCSDTIGRLSRSGRFSYYALPRGTWPTGIAAGADGALWFANRGTGTIGRITTRGSVTTLGAGGSVTMLGAGWKITDLGTLGGKYRGNSRAVAVNAAGTVAGVSAEILADSCDLDCHSFVWRRGKLTDIGTLAGGAHDVTDAVAISGRGDVVGWSYTRTGRRHGVHWRDGTISDLAVRGAETEAQAVNDKGEVAVTSSLVDSAALYVWRRGRMTRIGSPPSPPGYRRVGWIVVGAINERGWIAGYAETGGGSPRDYVGAARGFLWQGGRFVPLSEGRYQSYAADINERGEVVGSRFLEPGPTHSIDGPTRAFVWRNGRLQDLPMPSGSTMSHAVAINDRGQIIGSIATKGGWRGFVWQAGRFRDLGTLPGTNDCTPAAINARGQVVGWCRSTEIDGGDRPFLWERGRMIGLGTLGGDDARAVAINDRGEIVGSSYTRKFDLTVDVPEHAVLWTRR